MTVDQSEPPGSELIFVSGLSGAGKSVVLAMLEDLHYYCIDNLPLSLVGTLNPTELAAADPRCRKLAVGIDARTGGAIAEFPELLDELRATHRDCQIRVIFLHADVPVLLRRFSETRRRHPLTDQATALDEALSVERRLVEPIASVADITLDTSATNLHELRESIRSQLLPEDAEGLLLQLQSFGFKFGVPHGIDLLFDVRCLPNPHWERELRPLSGQDPEIARWLAGQPGVAEMQADIQGFLERWLPAYQQQDRNYLTVAIGCTGGRHRSVYLVDQLASLLARPGRLIQVRHTEMR